MYRELSCWLGELIWLVIRHTPHLKLRSRFSSVRYEGTANKQKQIQLNCELQFEPNMTTSGFIPLCRVKSISPDRATTQLCHIRPIPFNRLYQSSQSPTHCYRSWTHLLTSWGNLTHLPTHYPLLAPLSSHHISYCHETPPTVMGELLSWLIFLLLESSPF